MLLSNRYFRSGVLNREVKLERRLRFGRSGHAALTEQTGCALGHEPEDIEMVDRIVGTLEKAIQGGELIPGKRIPEQALASTLGVSRGLLREALRKLEARRLIERRAHSGIRLVDLSIDDFEQLLHVREALEAAAARAAAEHATVRERAGVDAAPEMIATCREAHPQQTWIVADMRTMSLGRTFDGILAWDSFFHLSHADQRRMFPLFRAHARRQAALMFTTGPGHGEAVGEFEGEPLYHASLDPEEYRALLDENGFSCVASKLEDPACGRHTIWLAQMR